MAEEVLLGIAAETILKKVAKEISLAWGLKAELRRLSETLATIQALLHDAEKTQVRGEAVKRWLKKLKVVGYSADDVLDEFAYDSLRRKVQIQNQMRKKVRYFFSLSNPVAFRIKMAHKVKNINSSLDNIKSEAIGFGLRERGIELGLEVIESRETQSYVDESKVVGRKADVSKIVTMLISSSNRDVISIIPIVGLAGLGKTTLAQLIYNDDQVKLHFDMLMWVCVSDDFDVKKILKQILESLAGNKYSSIENLDAIVKSLRKEMERKMYLLVLDDVWNEDPEKWEDLRDRLLSVSTSTGNGVIVTTRIDQVAKIMETLPRHHLEKLLEDDCWSIFKKRAFASGGPSMTPDFEAIGREIVKKCAGVPLAAKVLGGMMWSKKEKSEWLSIQKSEIWELPDDQSGILPALRLSFNHLLSPSLKQCFAYCSVFHKDFDIEKDDLIQHWMAQGLLQPFQKSNQEMEDVGNMFFNTLLSNSLLQNVVKDEYDNVVKCKMHDLVHDLALSVSKNLEESTHRLRTLFSKGNRLGDMLKNYKCLRVLNLRESKIEELPTSIGKLKHLRYLNVSWTKIKALPDSITKLYNLQTLRLSGCWSLKELPKEFRKLVSLRHFYMGPGEWRRNLMPPRIGELSCLQTLPFFVVGQDNGRRIEELGRLNNLRAELYPLKIYGLEHTRNREEARKANLLGNSSIHLLEFHWSRERDDEINNDEDVLEGLEPHQNLKGLRIENFKGVKFPPWAMLMMSNKSQLNSLVTLELENCDRCERMPTLGHLHSLKVVQIDGMRNLKCIGTEFYGQNHDGASSSSGSAVAAVFPALRKLSLRNMPELTEWLEAVSLPPTGTVFPCLEELDIEDCPQLMTAPGHFPSVKELWIGGIDHSQALAKMSRNLSSLTFLRIKDAKGSLELSSVLEELFGNNKNLRKLWIVGCEESSHWPNGLQNLASLEDLSIWFCSDLTFIPELHSLTTLRDFSIGNCEKLTCLPNKLETLASLENLYIHGCRNLMAIPDLRILTSLWSLTITNCERLTTYWAEGLLLCPTGLRELKIGGFSKELDYFPWPSEDITHHLSVSLEVLTLYGYSMPKIKSLPEQLQHLTALRKLTILSFYGLEALPEWLGNFSSLQTLEILLCQKPMNLPTVEAMRRLTKLQYLYICGCPLLEERCAKERGTEWHKIAHIPQVSLD